MTDLDISRIFTAGDSAMKEVVTRTLRSKLLHPNTPNVGIEEPIIETSCRHGRNCITLQYIPWNISSEPPFLANSQAGRNLTVITLGSQL
jgi:hypothetical protein